MWLAYLFGRKPNKGNKYRVTEEGASVDDIKLDIRNSNTPHRSVSLGLQSRHPPAPPPRPVEAASRRPSATSTSRAPSSHLPPAPPQPLSRAPSSHLPSAPPQPLSRAPSSHLPSAPPQPLSRAPSSRIPPTPSLSRASSHLPSAPPQPLSRAPSSHNGGKKKKATPKSAAGKRKK